MKSLTGVAIVVCGLVSALTGCGGGGPAGPAMAAVKGVVTHNGKPVEGAKVSFLLEQSSSAASGMTDASGNFTFQAPVGANNISITKTTQVGTGVMEAQADDDSNQSEVMQTKHELPVKYALPATSGLKQTVKKDGPNEFKFDLTD